MNQVKLNNLIRERKIVIPLYFLKMYKEFNLSIDELVLLFYLFDKDKTLFDPMVIAKDLNTDFMLVMTSISSLTDKGIVSVSTIKNDKGIMEEIIDLSNLFEKITMKIVKELNVKEENDLNIHNLIELEFNRKLTPLEHEMIDDWENNGFDKKLIKEAIKEASMNGVNNLRFIDRILLEWNKKGYKLPSDIKREETNGKDNIEVFNCDWLNADEEI